MWRHLGIINAKSWPETYGRGAHFVSRVITLPRLAVRGSSG